ncbi:MAG TPA: FecR domain-containing protein [Prolixibacteraceae bacterium]|nr:FecR domain-containing protein [Prolixibacteraceae bacterium]
MNYHDIKKYLEGNTTESESEAILKWLKNPENDSESRRILGKIWSNSTISLKSSPPDYGHLLHQVHHRINSQKAESLKSQGKFKVLPSGIFNIFSRVAAILILPLILLSLYFYFNPKHNGTQVASNTIREIYTKPGTRTKIELPDGTQVWLNDGTTFRYPEQFTSNKREVFVDGEAYFEVKSNPENPFVVNNSMMNTVVTGTHFNINAYSADSYFEATLMAGKISLKKNNQTLRMNPGEQVQYDTQLEKISQRIVDPTNASAWIEGKLIFNDEKLSTAIKKLARWYNVEIIVSEPKLNDYLLTGTIHDEKLDQTLRLISLALPVKFEFKKENNPTKIQRTIYMMRK